MLNKEMLAMFKDVATATSFTAFVEMKHSQLPTKFGSFENFKKYVNELDFINLKECNNTETYHKTLTETIKNNNFRKEEVPIFWFSPNHGFNVNEDGDYNSIACPFCGRYSTGHYVKQKTTGEYLFGCSDETCLDKYFGRLIDGVVKKTKHKNNFNVLKDYFHKVSKGKLGRDFDYFILWIFNSVITHTSPTDDNKPSFNDAKGLGLIGMLSACKSTTGLSGVSERAKISYVPKVQEKIAQIDSGDFLSINKISISKWDILEPLYKEFLNIAIENVESKHIGFKQNKYFFSCSLSYLKKKLNGLDGFKSKDTINSKIKMLLAYGLINLVDIKSEGRKFRAAIEGKRTSYHISTYSIPLSLDRVRENIKETESLHLTTRSISRRSSAIILKDNKILYNQPLAFERNKINDLFILKCVRFIESEINNTGYCSFPELKKHLQNTFLRETYFKYTMAFISNKFNKHSIEIIHKLGLTKVHLTKLLKQSMGIKIDTFPTIFLKEDIEEIRKRA